MSCRKICTIRSATLSDITSLDNSVLQHHSPVGTFRALSRSDKTP